MCSGPEKTKSTSDSSKSSTDSNSDSTKRDMKDLSNETEDSSSLLELAANNDVEGFKKMLERDVAAVCEVGLWYGRKKGARQMVLQHRTPLMVAATYGSLDVLKLILSQDGGDVNFSCVPDKSTALHCAASGGSLSAVEVVKLLLEFGADPNAVDVNGLRPFDVIVVPPQFTNMRLQLEDFLANSASEGSVLEPKLRVSVTRSRSSSPPLSSSPDNSSPSSLPNLTSSPRTLKSTDLHSNPPSGKKEYPIDPSLPDIKNSIYSTDEFRMFSFKIRPCSRAYSHDWTECPFVHPGENARRRDPRKYHYSCVPCPDFRKGACRRGDMCEYAHGVFECWLHPAQYRTRLCKDGISCDRRVCFFAHTPEELRPLYVSSGSAVPSPLSSPSVPSVMDMAAALNLFPGSPSSVSALSPTPFSQQCMSPPANSMPCSNGWPQPNVPMLHLPGSNLQTSRLRSSLSARDIPPEDLNMVDESSPFSQPRTNPPSLIRSGRSNILAPSNLEELFCSEVVSSPRYSDHPGAVFSPTHKSALFNQFQQQQSMLTSINASNVYSPKAVQHPLLQASLGLSSPGGMSPRSVEPISPISGKLSTFALLEKQHQLRSLSARDLGSKVTSSVLGTPRNSFSNWGPPNDKVDWSVHSENEFGRLKRSSSFEIGNDGEEPDLSWVQSLVKESPPETKEKPVAPDSGAPPAGEDLHTKTSVESVDHSMLVAWLEQMQLNQLVAQ